MRGRTRERITVKTLVEVSDGAGGNTSTDSTVGTYFCSVSRINAGQKNEEGREFTEDTLIFRTRYGVFSVANTDKLTVTYRGKVYKINSAVNVMERSEWLDIICSNDT